MAALLLAQAPAAPLCRQCCPSSCAAGWSCSCAGDCRPLSPLFLALFFCRCTFPPAVAAPFLPCTFFLSSRREDEPGLRVLQRWSSHRASIIDGHALRIRPAGRIFQSYSNLAEFLVPWCHCEPQSRRYLSSASFPRLISLFYVSCSACLICNFL